MYRAIEGSKDVQICSAANNDVPAVIYCTETVFPSDVSRGRRGCSRCSYHDDETSLFVLTCQPKLPPCRNIRVPESCHQAQSLSIGWQAERSCTSPCSPSDNAPRIFGVIACRYRHGSTRLLGPQCAFFDNTSVQWRLRVGARCDLI